MPAVICGPPEPGVPAHPVVVAARGAGLGQTPHADHAGRMGARLTPHRPGQVEQVTESVPWVDHNQVVGVRSCPSRILRGPGVTKTVAEAGEVVLGRPPLLVLHAHIPPHTAPAATALADDFPRQRHPGARVFPRRGWCLAGLDRGCAGLGDLRRLS